MNLLSEYFYYLTGLGLYLKNNLNEIETFGSTDHLNILFPTWEKECIDRIPNDTETKVVLLPFGLYTVIFNFNGFKGYVYPFHIDDLSIEAIERLRQLNDFEPNKSYHLLKKLPKVTSTRINHVIKLIHETLSSQTIYNKTENYFEPGKSKAKVPIDVSIDHPPLHDFENEEKLMAFISDGNTDDALEMLLYHLNHQRFTILGDTMLRSLKNNAIVYMTLAARAGIKGNLSPVKALGLADVYIVQVEKAISMEDLVTIDYNFTRDLCKLVKANKSYDQILRKINTYVEEHIDEKISRGQLSSLVNFSESYLSKYVKEKTGKSLTDHIHMIRLNQAAKLLITTEMDLLNIALSCGYDTQNYFSSCFKKYLGQSPGMYRRSQINL